MRGFVKDDVRMRGFATRVDVEVVDAFLVEHANALEGESVPLLECVGRVLAEAVDAEVDVPGFARSAMDGYALRGEESFGASAYDAIRLKVVGTSLPGAPFSGELRRGEAVRIMTGAPIPDAADAVEGGSNSFCRATFASTGCWSAFFDRSGVGLLCSCAAGSVGRDWR